ncbi:MAG: hypothetical protein KC731_18455 [Myxococcales bacterium]|nr:hypothetical protein [Myxococcales bacterium]
MPDEAILELVKNQLSGVEAAPSLPRRAAAAPAAPARSAPARKARAPKRRAKRGGARRTSEGREQALSAVEAVIKSSKGLSASQIASKAKMPQTRVSSLVRELKAAGRVHQGGDRRFARYAGDAKTAEKASEEARKSASGPVRKKKGRR